MKAVLSHSLGPGGWVELTHDLPRHAVAESAFLLRAMAGGFPAGTVHLAVVDPGVGGARAPVAIACRDGSALVGPDNGVLFPLATALGRPRGYRLDPRRIGARPRVGATFDGRDLFAPAAALLARGRSPDRLGRPCRLRRYAIPPPARTARGAGGEVVHIDHFGNLITNVPTDWVPPGTERVGVRVGRSRPRSLPWTTHYESLGAGRLGALGSSFGTLELAVDRGRADRRLLARVGAPVILRWSRAVGRRSIGK
jgi:S-adenosyl-L-methionine hydrolase (adenosine-forming)